MSTKTLSEERAAPAGPRDGLSNEAGNTVGGQSPASPRAAGTGLGVRIVNVTRANSLPGSGPFDYDDAVVLSESETEPHIISGQPQPKCLFRGTLVEAHEFVRRLP